MGKKTSTPVIVVVVVVLFIAILLVAVSTRYCLKERNSKRKRNQRCNEQENMLTLDLSSDQKIAPG